MESRHVHKANLAGACPSDIQRGCCKLSAFDETCEPKWGMAGRGTPQQQEWPGNTPAWHAKGRGEPEVNASAGAEDIPQRI